MIKPTRAEYLPNRAGDQSYRESLDAFRLHRYREALEKIADPPMQDACFSCHTNIYSAEIARKALNDHDETRVAIDSREGYMNFGGCPYDGCDGLFLLNLPDGDLPRFRLIDCDDCGRPVWYKFSRIAPEAWTADDFNAHFAVDEAAKTITPRKALEDSE